jgi:hypothetical protein
MQGAQCAEEAGAGQEGGNLHGGRVVGAAVVCEQQFLDAACTTVILFALFRNSKAASKAVKKCWLKTEGFYESKRSYAGWFSLPFSLSRSSHRVVPPRLTPRALTRT